MQWDAKGREATDTNVDIKRRETVKKCLQCVFAVCVHSGIEPPGRHLARGYIVSNGPARMTW